MKKYRKLIIILVILLIAGLTNPSEENFQEHIKSEMKEGNENKVQDLVDEGLSVQSKITSDYNSRILFSTVSTTIANEKRKYFGVFGFWIRTD